MTRRMMASVGMAALACITIVGGLAVTRSAQGNPVLARASIDRDTMRLVPDSVRVKVEVLNASGTRGVARRAMHYLRERGFDVVSLGNASARAESTVVIDRGDSRVWADAAARAVGGARVETRVDPSRYLHLTIVLGESFRAPPLVLYP